jgi:hypothetical protein
MVLPIKKSYYFQLKFVEKHNEKKILNTTDAHNVDVFCDTTKYRKIGLMTQPQHIVCLCMATLTGFSVLFPQLYGKCQGKTRKDEARPAPFLIFVLLYVLFVLFRSVYCLCVYVYCTTATGWLPNCS